MRFTQAWSSPTCSPTRATLYSGRYAYRNGVGSVIGAGSTVKLASSPDTFGKLAGDSGMKTALFGKWHVGSTASTLTVAGTLNNYKEYPVQLGFQTFAGNMGADFKSYTDWLYTVSAPSGSTGRYRTTATASTADVTVQTNTDALAWAASQAGKRRLSVVSYNLAHASESGGAVDWADAARSCGVTPTSLVDDQRAAVECVDRAIEDLLLGTPDLERTLVVFVGDNGTPAEVSEGQFEDGRGKGTVYESGIRVPFVIADGAAVADLLDGGSGNGGYLVPAGDVVAEPAGVVDIYATVADYLALSSATCSVGSTCAQDSVSARTSIEGTGSEREDVWSEIWTRGQSGYTGSAALQIGAAKLVVSVTAGACPSYELYDLAADRWEATDRFDDPDYAAEQSELLERLEGHRTAMTYAWLPDCG